MGDSNKQICRLCLELTPACECQSIETFKEDIQKVLRIQMDFDISDYPMACNSCLERLQDCSDFKSEITIIVDFKVDPPRQMTNSVTSEVCRLCMSVIEDQTFNWKDGVPLKDLVGNCFPQMDLNTVHESLVCQLCVSRMKNYYEFMKGCREVEQRIGYYCQVAGHASMGKVDLQELLKFKYCNQLEEPIIIKKESSDIASFEGNIIECFKDEECAGIKNENIKDESGNGASISQFDHTVIYDSCRDNGSSKLDGNIAQGKLKVINMSETMDSADEPMRRTLSPPRKRSKKVHLSLEIKEIILNLYKLEDQENPTLPLIDIEKSVAEKVGVSPGSVFKVVKEYKTTGTLSGPKAYPSRKGRLDSVDDFDRNAIRRKVHQFFFRNTVPTVDKVLQEVNDDADLPNFKRTTFYKLVKQLNFKPQRCGYSGMLMDKDEIVLWRRDYLTKIRAYRNEKRKIYYLGETWIDAGCTKSMTSSRQTLKNPSGKEKKLIICNIGSEDGFVPDALWTLESKKSGNYREEIDSKSFENWLSKTLPKLEENSVIVLDNAPYHSRKLEKIPTTSSKRSDIQDWLRARNIDFKDSLLKVQLVAIINEHKEAYIKYSIDEMANNQNKTVLRFPPYHCELNPLELAWADIKNYVAAKNVSSDFADMKNLLNEAAATITPEKWKKFIQHTIEEAEKKMWQLDHLIETQVEPLINNLDDSSTPSSSE